MMRLAAGAALSYGVAGCAQGGQPEIGTAGAGGQPVPVTLMSRPSEEETFNKRTAAFRAQYPKIALEYQSIPGDYVQVIRTNQAEGTLADAIYFESGTYEASVGSGMVQALDGLVQRDRLDLKQWYTNAIDAVVRQHTEAFRENRAAPNPQAMRALTTEVQAVLDQPRG
jgi:ABC-type glycerol-3-phosphate transport system substrate-binding protein